MPPKDNPPFPAIVLCCSKAGLAVIRALGAAGIPVVGVAYGRGQVGLSSRFLVAGYWSPDPADDELGFIDFLLSLAGRWPGAAVFPSDDASLVAVSRHKESLAPLFRVVAEDWQVVRTLIEKHRTYEIAREAGVPCPRLKIVEGIEDAVHFAREVGFPCLLKPSVGHIFFRKHRRKMLLIQSEGELRQHIGSAMSYGGELMLCEFIPGDDTSGTNYNSFCLAGRPLQEFTSRKLRLSPTLIGFPTVVQSRRLPDVLAGGRQMIAAVRYNGFSCMEFKRDARDGVYKLMEINGRHNYSGQLAVSCGINFPYLSYLLAHGLPLPDAAVEQREGVRWIDEERDTLGALAAMLQGRKAAREYFQAYRGKKVCAVFSPTDPLPAVRLVGSSVAGAARQVRLSRDDRVSEAL